MTHAAMDPSILDIALATGLHSGSKLRDCRRVAHTELAAFFNDNMTKEQWLEYGRMLKQIKDRSNFYQADWMRFGKNKFGIEAVEDAISQLQLDFREIQKSSMIALLPVNARRANLTSEHHYVISVMMDKGNISSEDAFRWMNLAEEESLSAIELQKSIDAGKIVRSEDYHANRDGYLSIHGLRTQFQRWLKNVEDDLPMSKMAPDQKALIYEEIKPIGELYEKLKQELSK